MWWIIHPLLRSHAHLCLADLEKAGLIQFPDIRYDAHRRIWLRRSYGACYLPDISNWYCSFGNWLRCFYSHAPPPQSREHPLYNNKHRTSGPSAHQQRIDSYLNPLAKASQGRFDLFFLTPRAVLLLLQVVELFWLALIPLSPRLGHHFPEYLLPACRHRTKRP
ncbi:hypothetical protein BDV09DRAFT_66657 [Aspergillus tetrazonus]